MVIFRSCVELPEGNPRKKNQPTGFLRLWSLAFSPRAVAPLISDGQQDTMATLVQRQLRGVLTEGTNVKMSYDL